MPDDDAEPDGWQLDGNSAEAYERYLVPGMFAPWADVLVGRAGLEPGERALDVGCGTGVVARRAAEAVGPAGEVVGVDPNDGMLEVAKSVAADRGLAIEWRPAEATVLPFADGRFDAVCCQQVLQFLSAPGAALEEMARVLAADGCLALAVWRPIEFHPTYVTMADALERHAGDEAAAMMRSPFPDWTLADLRGLVREAGFGEVAITIGIGSMRYPSTEEFLRREAASSPLAGPLGALSADVREVLVRDLEDDLRPYTDDEGVVFPMETYLVVARR